MEDFNAFIARGNILDLAIGFIMGAAFSALVKTFTDGIIMPIIGIITGGIDFKDKVINLGDMPVSNGSEIAAAIETKQPLIMYGQFITDLLTFFIVAAVMFSGVLCPQTFQFASRRADTADRRRSSSDGNP